MASEPPVPPRPQVGKPAGMPDGYAESLGLLEFDQIRTRLASYARTLMGRRLCMSLMPSGDVMEIATRQQEAQ